MGKSVKTSLFLFEVATLVLSAHSYAEETTSYDAEVKTHLRGQVSAAPKGALFEANHSTESFVDGVAVDLSFLNASGEPGEKKANLDLEDQVADLFKMSQMRASMSKAEFEASPLGASVKKIYHIIEKVMMPTVEQAHDSQQKSLDNLAVEVGKCGVTKNDQVGRADHIKTSYLKFSPLHKTCRAGEAGDLSEKNSCWEEEADKKKVRDLMCKQFDMVKKQVGDQQASRQIMKKGGSESTDSFVNRVTATVCGGCVGKGCKISKGFGSSLLQTQKCGYEPYSCGCGFKCKYDKAKDACDAAKDDWKKFHKQCKASDKQYDAKKHECDSLQDQMDDSACKRAVGMKDACESYAECYFDKKKSFGSLQDMVKVEEKDRVTEWKGLKRMKCLIQAFTGGKVTDSELKKCRAEEYEIDHLKIEYPKLVILDKCEVPHLYPNTPTYKAENFAPLPALAKGKQDSYECTGLNEISTEPKEGSPPTCNCTRVTLNGPYSPGPVVKCENCLDVRRSTEKNSCPDGTKIFSPRSRTDWKTFLTSAGPLAAPNWIVDITRPQNGCGGCKSPMNSHNNAQRTWTTSDGSAWWLRSSGYTEPNGDYHANCYMDLGKAKSEDDVRQNDHNCNYHSKSYYCQSSEVNLEPKEGSPPGCQCKMVTLTGKYSAGALMKCTGCLKVSKSMEKNSCPVGTKIFSPRSREDWKTFISSAAPLRSPNFIVDITQAQNGCGGCTKGAMKSSTPNQATWRTSDNTPWFLRGSKYTEPSAASSYHANCYMDVLTAVSEDSIIFAASKCSYFSNSYYCQTAKTKKKAPPVDDIAPPPMELAAPIDLGPAPKPKKGGKYEMLMCDMKGLYTGVNAKCGHFEKLSEDECWERCEQSASARGKEGCDEKTGVPDCKAMVYDKSAKMCMLHRSCTELEHFRGPPGVEVVSRLKATYDPAAETFEVVKDRRCKGTPYTKVEGEKKGLKGVTEAQCWQACFQNKGSGREGVQAEVCVAMAFYPKTGYCDLYDECKKTRKKTGVITYKKITGDEEEEEEDDEEEDNE